MSTFVKENPLLRIPMCRKGTEYALHHHNEESSFKHLLQVHFFTIYSPNKGTEPMAIHKDETFTLIARRESKKPFE